MKLVIASALVLLALAALATPSSAIGGSGTCAVDTHVNGGLFWYDVHAGNGCGSVATYPVNPAIWNCDQLGQGYIGTVDYDVGGCWAYVDWV